MLYGFPPNVGAVGTAALLDVPKSLENILRRLDAEGYDVGDFVTEIDSSGERLVSYFCKQNVDKHFKLIEDIPYLVLSH